MPHYYFHICNGDGFTEDEEGRELADESAARAEAVKGARSIMADELQLGTMNLASFIEVENGAHEHLFTVSFTEVVDFTTTKCETRPQRKRG